MTAKSKFILEYHNSVDSPAEERTIELVSTPGRREIWSNEIADDLERLGAGKRIVIPKQQWKDPTLFFLGTLVNM